MDKRAMDPHAHLQGLLAPDQAEGRQTGPVPVSDLMKWDVSLFFNYFTTFK